MCNIAGYVGRENAAPILLEMLRRQQGFDGGVCTGITTFYKGRLYTRRIVGDVDRLIESTDALTLPGTIGIAHSRPGGNSSTFAHSHPFVSPDGKLAGLTNGTSRGADLAVWQKMTEFLDNEGYTFTSEEFVPASYCVTSNGGAINPADMRTMMMHYYSYRCGMPLTAAMARTDTEMYKDGVIELLSADTPDRLYVLRTSRPAAILRTEGGTYVASTRFAFPDGLEGEYMQLPVMYPCEIYADRVNIVKEHRMRDCEDVSEITDYTLEEGYRRICDMLRGKENEPLHFDDLELAVWKDMRDLFPGDHTLIQDARLVYDVLWRLHTEGRLKIKSILLVNGKKCTEDGEYANDARFIPGSKNRYHMWID